MLRVRFGGTAEMMSAIEWSCGEGRGGEVKDGDCPALRMASTGSEVPSSLGRARGLGVCSRESSSLNVDPCPPPRIARAREPQQRKRVATQAWGKYLQPRHQPNYLL